MYCVLEDNQNRLSICPQNWIKTTIDDKQIVYWPRSNQTAYINDPDSEPVLSGPNKWLIVSDKIKRTNIPTKGEAEKIMDEMLENSRTETDDDQMTNRSEDCENNRVRNKSANQSGPNIQCCANATGFGSKRPYFVAKNTKQQIFSTCVDLSKAN